MRNHIILLVVSVLTVIFANAQEQNLTVQSLQGTHVDTILKHHLESTGVLITNGKFNDVAGNVTYPQIGTFNRNGFTSFPFETGLVLTTGNVSVAAGPNNSTSASQSVSPYFHQAQWLLDYTTGSSVTSAAVLEFDFVAMADTFAFNYIFASEEYCEYVNHDNVNDVFAFILDGYDPVTNEFDVVKNVAIVPGSITAANPLGTPVSIGTINHGNHSAGASGPGSQPSNSQFFVCNYGNSNGIQYDGYTTALSACAAILGCQTYHMKLGVSNVGDLLYDSGIFLEESSFYSPHVTVDTTWGTSLGGDTLIQNCRDLDLTFSLERPARSGYTAIIINVDPSSTALLGTDYVMFKPNGTEITPYNNSFFFPIGDTLQEVHVSMLPTAQFPEGVTTKTATIYVRTQGCSGQDDEMEARFFFEDTITLYFRANDSIQLRDTSVFVNNMLEHIEVEKVRGSDDLDYQWYSSNWTPNPPGILNPHSLVTDCEITETHTYYVVATDRNGGCLADTATVQVTVIPTTAQVVYWMGNDQVNLTCQAEFYDSGGLNGNIVSDNENADGSYYIQFASPEDTYIKCVFNSFDVNGLMQIYDGAYNEPTRRLIGQFCTSTLGTTYPDNLPPVLFASGNNGSSSKTLTFVYIGASGDTHKSGWHATISCVPELVEIPDESPFFHLSIQNIPQGDYSNVEDPSMIDLDTLYPEITLKAIATTTGRYTNDYTVKQIPYDETNMVFGYNDGDALPLNIDDHWIQPINLPAAMDNIPAFKFVFFGKPYTTVYPGSNGIISFDPHALGSSCTWQTYVPSTTGPPYTSTPYNYANCVYGIYEDINPSTSACPGNTAIKVGVLGTYPCRAFVFNYNHIGLFACCSQGDNMYNTYQMVLYEGTNIIDVYVKHRACCTSWNGGRGVIGLQNKTSSQILTVPGMDFGTPDNPITWTADNMAFRFTPISPPNEDGILTWYIDSVATGNIISQGSYLENQTITVSPTGTTRYISEYQFTDAGGTQYTLRDTTIVLSTQPIVTQGVCWPIGDTSLTVSTCDTLFYDSGGPDAKIYTVDLNESQDPKFVTFVSATGTHIKCVFTQFSVNGVMKIYDGEMTDSNRRLIGQFCTSTLDMSTNNMPPVLFSSSNALSFVYCGATGDLTKAGWAAMISCVSELVEIPDESPFLHPKIQNIPQGDYSNVDDPAAIYLDTLNPAITLKAIATATGHYTYDYTVKQIPFDSHIFEFNQGISIDANHDDQWLAGVNLPFTFYFFGDPYTTIYPGTNGLISMTYRPAASGLERNLDFSYGVPPESPPYNSTIPGNIGSNPTSSATTPFAYNNCIYGVFEDVDAYNYIDKGDGLGLGAIRYGVLYEYPNRAFVFNYLNIGLFGLTHDAQHPDNYNTYQMVLYEGTNIIDIYVKHRKCCATTNNHGEGIIGLQNKTSSQILLAPERGMGGWETDNEAWRFTPISPPDEDGTLTWYINSVAMENIISQGPYFGSQTITVSPTETTWYISEYQFTDESGTQYTLRDTTLVLYPQPEPEDSTGVTIRNAEFTVYPNPTHDAVYVKMQNVVDMPSSIEVLDLNGKLLFSVPAQETTRINLAHLPAGIYFLRTDGRREKLVKIIKQ